MRFDGEHTRMLDAGRPPILIENIFASLRLRTDRGDLKVQRFSGLEDHPAGFVHVRQFFFVKKGKAVVAQYRQKYRVRDS